MKKTKFLQTFILLIITFSAMASDSSTLMFNIEIDKNVFQKKPIEEIISKTINKKIENQTTFLGIKLSSIPIRPKEYSKDPNHEMVLFTQNKDVLMTSKTHSPIMGESYYEFILNIPLATFWGNHTEILVKGEIIIPINEEDSEKTKILFFKLKSLQTAHF